MKQINLNDIKEEYWSTEKATFQKVDLPVIYTFRQLMASFDQSKFIHPSQWGIPMKRSIPL